MAPSSSTATTSVQVALRIRPPTSQDATSIPSRFQRSVIHAASSTAVSVDVSATAPPSTGANAGAPIPISASAAAGKKQTFNFDQVHGPSTTQHALFTATTEPLISRFLEGFNCTILAYGQTSSGKTYSMTGVDLDADPSDPNNGMGIIPRAVSTIFQRSKEIKADRGATWSYSIKGSFIEIYNEDLIDLLSMDDSSGGRREVQIREDKDGHIIWGGLREISVKNAHEVMGLIQKGSSIRRTNETNMNAQSSRSHAIFSLTLTQRKFSGSGLPPRSSSPLPPTGRSPSRIGRPTSAFIGAGSTRVSSPTFGRPETPSLHAAMGRGGLRPSSALGSHKVDGRGGSLDEDQGDWVTIVSKFHFVDLAGSERLKRTAAAGERIKEGISINSGLLALGNVISALGDPARAKSHTATHIPYRDSKLTRLLQDSLGGNAHTLMIACVSPAEWNVGETVNTLKYANRARNIKNRATIDEKEEGWDDLEWLRGMVTRLRKEVKTIKEGGTVSDSVSPRKQFIEVEGASKKVLLQMVDLQNNYEDLREKFVERTEELTRLRRELGEKQRMSSGGTTGGTSKYEEIVGPVIEEYEKTISAMEAELNLNRAALRHTNELVEEKEEELSVITERHSATEFYVEELRSRVSKLTEREASTEAYIRDLEEKVKHYDDSSLSSSESVSDLKREISRYKDVESHSSQYITDMEARLARSDESVLALRASVERLEAEAQRRREEVEFLQSRLEALKNDGEGWRTDLEERERKVKELERRMQEWEAKKIDAGEARVRLGSVVEEVAEARRSLTIDTAKLQHANLLTTEVSPIGTSTHLEDQLVALQQTHTATLADLSSVSAKYRDALREISDLAAQITEIKLQSSSQTEESPERQTDRSTSRRRLGRKESDGQINSTGRRLFFREAASAESLHSRSLSQSQSLSQELSSARSRKASISSQNGFGSPVMVSPSRKGSMSSLNGMISASPYSPSFHRTDMSVSVNPNERSVASLEKEIMRLQEVLKDREAEITVLEGTLKDKDRATPRISVNGTQLVDDANNVEEGDLSPKTISRFQELRQSITDGQIQEGTDTSSDADESLVRLNELMLSMAQKESQHRELVDGLNDKLAKIRRQHDDLNTLSRDQAVNMSNELRVLREEHENVLNDSDHLRQRESELLESLTTAEAQHSVEIESLRAEHETAIRTKESEVDALLVSLKEEHHQSLQKLRDELTQASTDLAKTHQDHEEAFGRLNSEHEDELRRLRAEVEEVLARTNEQHSAAVMKIVAEHEETIKQERLTLSSALDDRVQEHSTKLNKLLGDHAVAMQKQSSDANITVNRLREEHAATLQAWETSLQNSGDEHNATLEKLRAEHATALENQAAEGKIMLDRAREEHAAELRMAEIARDGSLSESQSAQLEILTKLQDEHALAIEKKEAAFVEDVGRLKAEHDRLLAKKEEEYASTLEELKSTHSVALSSLEEEQAQVVERLSSDLVRSRQEHEQAAAAREASVSEDFARLKAEHSQLQCDNDAAHAAILEKLQSDNSVALANLEAERAQDVQRLNSALIEGKQDLEASTAELRADMEAALRSLKEQHAAVLREVEQGHEEELVRLKADHQNALTSVSLIREQERSVVDRTHTEAILKLTTEHQAALAEVQSNLIAAQEQHRRDLEQTRAQTERLISQEREHQATSLAQLDEIHARECDALRKDQDLRVQELASLRTAAEEASVNHRNARATLESSLLEKDSVIGGLQGDLKTAHGDRDKFVAEVRTLRAELEQTVNEQAKLVQEASNRQSLVEELEKYRSVVGDMQINLQRTKDEMDALQLERARQDTLVRQLQAQLSNTSNSPTRIVSDRSRANGIPPPTPPPTVPPPPPPPPPKPMPAVPVDVGQSISSLSSVGRTSSSSHDSQQLESPSTSVALSMVNSHPEISAIDVNVIAKLDEQARHIEEQEAMINTLNKQLTHCEGDLQAHMDLVGTLETSLSESEKNLRKARTHATELARERDTLNGQVENLRKDLQEAKREITTVRRSVIEEKQVLENRVDEERRAKEKARAQLDSRMDELQKRKSKFACL